MMYSIAIPLHNNKDTILRCAKSALGQSYNNIEILISDTSSTDDSEKLIQSVANDRIKYFRNNKSWSMWENHNFLINASKGDYIIFLHADDYLLPDAINIIDCKLKKLNYPQRIILSGSSIYKDFKNTIQVLNLDIEKLICGEDAVRLFSMGGLTPSGSVFSADLKKFGGFLDDGLIVPYSDCWTELYLCLNGFRYSYINDILYIRSSNGTKFKYGNKREIKEVYSSLKEVYTDEQTDIIKNAAVYNLSFELLKFFVQDSNYRANIRWALFKIFIRNPLKYLEVLNILFKY